MKKDIVLEKIYNLITEKKIEVFINNKSNENLIEVFYIGLGKTGSSTICASFIKKNVAHWHTTGYFENIYQTNLLTKNNLTLLDIVKFYGKKFNFKPLIIESVRDPIQIFISSIFQGIKTKHLIVNEPLETYRCNLIDKIENNDINIQLSPITLKYCSNLLDYKFDNYYFYETFNYKQLLLKIEFSNKWESIIKKLGYDFKIKSTNLSKNEINYDKKIDFEKNFKLTSSTLNKIYNTKVVKTIYSDNEIENFKLNWCLKK